MRVMLLMLALGAAVVAACKSREPAAPPGVLQLRSAPSAEVLVDGHVVGKTPLRHEVGPGPHRVVLRAPAFHDLHETVEIAAGHIHELEWVLTPTDPSDPHAIRRLAVAFELEVVRLEPVVRERGMRDAKRVVPCFPRGDVRLIDLREYRVEVGADFEADGVLKFRRRKKDIHSVAFDPAARTTTAAIPDAVQAALDPGALITWGYYPNKGKAVTAKFKVVRDDPRLVNRIKKMQKRMAGQPEVVLRQLRAQLFLNKRLYMAAYLEARRAYELSNDAEQAVAIMQSALRRMRLDRTALWEEVQQAAADLPARRKGQGERARKGARP